MMVFASYPDMRWNIEVKNSNDSELYEGIVEKS